MCGTIKHGTDIWGREAAVCVVKGWRTQALAKSYYVVVLLCLLHNSSCETPYYAHCPPKLPQTPSSSLNTLKVAK